MNPIEQMFAVRRVLLEDALDDAMEGSMASGPTTPASTSAKWSNPWRKSHRNSPPTWLEGLFFGGVALKYQRDVPHASLADAGRIAAGLIEVVCTGKERDGNAIVIFDESGGEIRTGPTCEPITLALQRTCMTRRGLKQTQGTQNCDKAQRTCSDDAR